MKREGGRDRPDGELEGQTALVTGASSGIGRGVAVGLARAGARVVVIYMGGKEAAEEVVDLIRSTGGDALPVRAAVSVEGEVKDMFASAVRAFGTVDILVNNAGLQRDAPIEEMTLCPGFATGV